MGEFKGTKGKWNVIIPTYEQTNGFVNVSTNDGDITCYNGITKGGAHPKSLANALLISKSPEMLDFINRISGEMLRNDFVLDEKWYEQANKLIKEATEI
jgi:hypothetical protein